MEEAVLEERLAKLEVAVQNLLGPNLVFEEWTKRIRDYETRLNQRLDALEGRLARLESHAGPRSPIAGIR